MKRLFVLDTEDDSWGNPLVFDFFDGEKHRMFFDRQSAWNWIFPERDIMVWAVNLEYDLINLFGDWLAYLCTLRYVSSGLMLATMNDADAVWYDTLRHWPMSVEAMGEYVGMRKSRDYLSDKVTPRLVSACKRDTEITWKFVDMMLKQYKSLGLDIKPTLPSMALQLWRKTEGIEKLPRFSDNIRERFREGYYGGRVEVYRFGEIDGPVNHYDVNSLYPHVMADREYPDLSDWYKTSKPDFSREGMARITIDMPYLPIPCLPVRSEIEILFPYGRLSGAWTYPEIRQALEDGGKILGIDWAYEFPSVVSPFKKYVRLCWENRRKSERGSLENIWWKLAGNSLYGKFGQGDTITLIHRNREFDTGKPSQWSNVIWSAYITSYARLELLAWLRRAKDVYYCDTDSVFTPDSFPVDDGILGALKREGCYGKAQFFGNKVYVCDEKYKARGVSNKCRLGRKCKVCVSCSIPAKDFIRTGRAVYRRPARFRESRRSFARANAWYDVEKTFRAEYTKRIVRPDGSTEPWNYPDYLENFG